MGDGTRSVRCQRAQLSHFFDTFPLFVLMVNQPSIDKNLCIRCGQCARTCPVSLFQCPDSATYPAALASASDFCIACHHCIAVCPTGAVSVGNIGADDCLPIVKENIPRFEQMTTLARLRRSVRRYADKPIEDRVIAQLLDVVRWAPSAKNGLPVKWIVVNNREKLRELGELVLQCVETQPGCETMRAAWDAAEAPIFRGAPCLVAAYADETAMWPQVDTAIAVEVLDLCVAAMRMGSCWAGFFVLAAQNSAAINGWLGLTPNQKIYGGLMLGYIGDVIYQRVPHRPELDLRWIQ